VQPCKQFARPRPFARVRCQDSAPSLTLPGHRGWIRGIASYGFAVPSSRARFLEVQSKGGDTHVENDDAPSECGKDHCFLAFDTLTHPTSLRLYGVFHSQWIARTYVRLHIQGLRRIDGVIKFRISSLTPSSGYVHTLYRLESHSTFSVSPLPCTLRVSGQY
jgi:hypothetical protein